MLNVDERLRGHWADGRALTVPYSSEELTAAASGLFLCKRGDQEGHPGGALKAKKPGRKPRAMASGLCDFLGAEVFR